LIDSIGHRPDNKMTPLLNLIISHKKFLLLVKIFRLLDISIS